MNYIRVCLFPIFSFLPLFGFSQKEYDLSQDWVCRDSCSTIVYEKEISIPKQLAKSNIYFNIERVTSSCKLFIDQNELLQIEEGSLFTSSRFQYQRKLKKGHHILRMEILTNSERTNKWQGFWGKVYMTSKSSQEDIKTCQNSENQTILVQGLQTDSKKDRHTIIKFDGNNIIPSMAPDNTYFFKYDTINRWDEQHPKLNILEIKKKKETYSNQIGIKEISRKNGILMQNGKRLFLRVLSYENICNQHQAPPSFEDEWKQIITRLKEKGFNALLFEDLVPIETLFRSADAMGFYIICPASIEPNIHHPSYISPSTINDYHINLPHIPTDETGKVFLENVMCNEQADGFVLQNDEINIDNFAIIPIIKFPSTKLENSKNFYGEIVVANYTTEDLTGTRVNWIVENKSGFVLSNGSFGGKLIKTNRINSIGSIFFPLCIVGKGEEITLKTILEVGNKGNKNTWNMKVY